MKLIKAAAAGVLASGLLVLPLAAPASAHPCPVRTDQPHLSSHAPGNVNVTGTTECSGGWVYVRTTLYRERWYGLQYLNSTERRGINWVQTNTAAWCRGSGLFTYQAQSYHTAGAHGGASWYTRNSARFSC